MYQGFSAIQVLSTVLLILVVTSSVANVQRMADIPTAAMTMDVLNGTLVMTRENVCAVMVIMMHAVILCDTQRSLAALLDCNCVTYDIQTKSTFEGSCYYNCINDKKSAHSWLPANPERLINSSVCTRFHRTGLLCAWRL